MKAVILACSLLLSVNLKAQVSASSAFGSYLAGRYPGCVNPAGNINPLWPAIVNEDTLIISPPNYIGWYDGLQYFTSLTYLDISGTADMNGVIYIPSLPSTLKTYICRGMARYPNTSPTFASMGLHNIPAGLEYLDCSESNSKDGFTTLPAGLKYLDCSGNRLNNLVTLPPNLIILKCNNNYGQEFINPGTNYYGLFSLPALPNTMTYLNCSNNRLSGLPPLPASLTFLNCSWNDNQGPGINILPSLPSGLIHLDFSNNNVNVIPPLPLTLKKLFFPLNNVQSIPPLPASLDSLNCNFNQVTALPALPSGMRYLFCPDNQLTSLPQLPDSLRHLTCYNNQLTSLPDLPDSLQYINCGHNNLSGLPAFPPALNTIWCFQNNISCIPHLPASMGNIPVSGNWNLGFDDDKIVCLPNYIPGIRLYSPVNGMLTSYPVCTPLNNIHHCVGVPAIEGHAFYDLNSNGIKDLSENFKANVHVGLSNGQHSYSNDTGYYMLLADTGMLTLSVQPVPFYTTVPSTVNFTFGSFDTLGYQLIALQPSVNADSMNISVVPLNTARPGFSFSYHVRYENVGTNVVAPNIVLKYDNARLIYSSSTNPAVTHNVNTLSLSEGNFTPGHHNQFVANFTVKPVTPIGDTIWVKGTVSANANVSVDSTYSVVRGSFDPNDKQATPSLTLHEISKGKEINYLIRFQNTGTDTAFNVLVTDTLSNLSDHATFKMVNASHPCIVSRIGKHLLFEFRDILLPDSNINEPLSHGFIQFRLKPVVSVIVNDVIPNKASIYFDFNAPVVTNTCSTTIDSVVGSLTLLEFEGTEIPGNAALLHWRTENEINTSRFDIQESIDGSIFSSIGQMAAYGHGNNNYDFQTTLTSDSLFYRLKMIYIEGTFTYSPVVIIKRNKLANNIKLLSNPVNNVLSIEVHGLPGTEGVISNSQGQRLTRFTLREGVQEINVGGLAAGIYYLMAQGITKKFLIVRR